MSISTINNITDISKISNVSVNVKTAMTEKAVEEKAKREDTYVKSDEQKNKDQTGIYSRESILEQLKNSEEQRVKAFQETLKSMLAKQGETSNLTLLGMKLNVTEEDRLKAEKAISAGGEYSVENVTDRIMNMAKALAGDDPTKIDTLQNAVIKGFEKAAGVLGRKKDLSDMPDITRQTYDKVMKEFSDWKSSYNKTESDSEDAA